MDHFYRKWRFNFANRNISQTGKVVLKFKGASSLHIQLLEVVRMIKYRVSKGKWSIFYRIWCSRQISIWFTLILRVASLTYWKKWTFLWSFFVSLFGSMFWGLYRPLMYMCNICIDSYPFGLMSGIQICNLIYNILYIGWRYHSLKTEDISRFKIILTFRVILCHVAHSLY